MTNEQRQIIAALQTLKTVCISYECNECPLSDSYGNCLVSNYYPREYVVNTEELWKALRND